MAEQLQLDGGCMWVVGQTTRGVSGPKPKPVSVFCNKLRQPGSVYCPKHALYQLDEEMAPIRKREAVKRRKEWKKTQEMALEASPLRAENPSVVSRQRKAPRAAGSEERVFG